MNTHPTHTEVGGWGQLANDSPICVGNFVIVVVVLLLHACVFGVWVLFFWHWCVCGESVFVPKYLKCLKGTSGFIFPVSNLCL